MWLMIKQLFILNEKIFLNPVVEFSIKLYWRRMVHPDLAGLFNGISLLGFYYGIVSMPVTYTPLIFFIKKKTKQYETIVHFNLLFAIFFYNF